MSAGSNFIVLPAEIGDENEVRVPRSARICKGPHRWDGTIVNNKAVGYVAVAYDPAQHQYPKMLYHPEWGMKPKPDMARFAIGCVTPEQFGAALTAFTEAVQKWERGNRTKTVENEKEEKRLLAKGWLNRIPQRKEGPQFDQTSDEL